MPVVNPDFTCLGCGVKAPEVGFYTSRHAKRGHLGRCVACHNAMQKASYKRHSEVRRARRRDYERTKRAEGPGYARARRLKYEYGLTPEEWERMFEGQGRCCAICQDDQPGSSHGWHTDHCHKSGKVRFILCAHCNRGLGAFKDNPNLLRLAASMLEESERD